MRAAAWSKSSVTVALAAAIGLLTGCGEQELAAADATAGAVDDRVAVLAPPERRRIADYHAALREARDIDLRVLTIDSGGDVERTAHEYFSAMAVGSNSAAGRGLLLVIDPANERMRLEVATSLEGVYTDAFVSYVQYRQMAPFFAAGRVADGILATTELIVARAADAERHEEFAPPMAARSMGGGASAAAPIGVGDGADADLQRQTARVDVAGLDPLAVVEAYHERMDRRDGRVDLALYSNDTIAMLRGRVVTAAQMDNVVKTYRSCAVDGVRVANDAAVVRYRIDQRQCAPYFLRREADAWKLDFTVMSSSIRFNHENEWRFATPAPDDYRFAFADWRFDANGFPRTALRN